MVNISTANPFTKPCPRPQANFDWPVSLPLSGQKAGQARKRAGPFGSCPAYGSRVGAQVALQRCLTLRTSGASLSCFFTVPFKRGHLYFAKKGTFLLWVDSEFFAILSMEIGFGIQLDLLKDRTNLGKIYLVGLLVTVTDLVVS